MTITDQAPASAGPGSRPARVEHFHDPCAPVATSVVPVVYAVVRDRAGRVLLVRRADTGDWELPGGRVDPGESAVTAVVREVAEESGLLVDVTGPAGLYTDPDHVVRSRGGAVWQPFAMCFHATARPGVPVPDGKETDDARWWDPDDIDALPVQPAVRRRLSDALTRPTVVHLG
jgi:8-oxo-dGTP diphosphatase